MDTFLNLLNKDKENNVEVICQNLGVIHSKVLNESKTKHTNILLDLIEMNIAMMRLTKIPTDFENHFLEFCESVHSKYRSLKYFDVTEHADAINIDDIYKLKHTAPWCFDENDNIITEELNESFDKRAGLTKKQIKLGYIKCPPGTKGEGRIRKKGECNKKVNKKLSKALKRSAKANVSKRKLAAIKAARTKKRLAGRRRE